MEPRENFSQNLIQSYNKIMVKPQAICINSCFQKKTLVNFSMNYKKNLGIQDELSLFS